jgi:CBS domain-containing protein
VDHRQRRFIVMRKDNATASSDASGTLHQPRQADPAESALERYLAVIAGADKSGPTAQHAAQVGPKVVSDVMTVGVVSAHEQAGFKVIVASLVRNRISAVPVIDDDRKVIGVVSESDLLARVVAEPDRTSVIGHPRHGRRERPERIYGETASSLMTTPAVTTTPDCTIADAARLAAKARVRRLPVVDTDDVLLGIVTRADLLRVFLEDDAEIHTQILDDIIVRQMALGPSDVKVFVNEGIVTLRGELANRQMVQQLLESVHAIPAVVAVKSRLTSPADDAPRSRPVSLR